MNEDYGTVTYEGKILKLTQFPYLDTDFSRQIEIVDAHGHAKLINALIYTAHAFDDNENNYDVTYQILKKWWNDETKEYELPEDEEKCCDWNIYSVREC